MSCQQVSRFITTTPNILNTTVLTAKPSTLIAAAPTRIELTSTTSTTTAETEAALVSINSATAIAASTACSTTSSSIASLTAATAEDQDPYVFTESVHATPPVHFNAQKSRIRHVDSAVLPATTTTTTTTPTTTATLITYTDTVSEVTATNVHNCNQNSDTTTITTTTETTIADSLPITATTTSATTFVTNCNAVSTVTATSTSTILAVKSASQIKNGIQQQQQRKSQAHSKSPLLFATPPLSPPLAVRVQQQQQQQQQQQHMKVLSPTCGLQLTPSLWQTPLLLDTNTSNINSNNTIPTTNYNNNININVNNNNNNNNITSNNGNNFSNVATITTPQLTTNGGGGHVTINSPMHSPNAVTAALMANITHTAIPLPPSNFHHTTLAQHLQKVECIKKPPKRQNLNSMCIPTQKVVITPPATPPTPTRIATATATSSPSLVLLPPLQPLQISIEQIQQQQQQQKLNFNKENQQQCTGDDNREQQQHQQHDEHSDSDLNEIPVNVIYRTPQPAQATVPTTKTTIINANEKQITETFKHSFEDTNLPTLRSTPTIQQQQQITKPTLIMPCTKVDIEAAVSTLQNMQLKALNDGISSTNVQENLQPENYLNKKQVTVNKRICNQTPAIKQNKSSEQKLEISSSSASSATTLSSNKKSKGKQQLVPPSLNQDSLAADHGSAVAVVKMSSIELSADISDLSNATVLPYCVQKHWLDSECPQKYLISREERIAQSKNLLRRQALQLLNTHSLQKLPMHAARKRLICVDRLWRKYDQQRLHTDRF